MIPTTQSRIDQITREISWWKSQKKTMGSKQHIDRLYDIKRRLRSWLK